MKILNLNIWPTEKLLYYNIESLNYAFCYVDTKITIIEEFTICKELLPFYIGKIYSNINFSNLRLILDTSKIFKTKIKQIIKIINLFSKINNWEEVKIYKVKHKKNLYIFNISKQWFEFPQLISIITFIIAGCYEYNITNCNSIKKFLYTIKTKCLNEHYNDSIFSSSNNWVYIIPLIINNYNYLFDMENSSYLYDYTKCANKNLSLFFSRSGIKSLCLGKSLSSSLNKKLKLLKE